MLKNAGKILLLSSMLHLLKALLLLNELSDGIAVISSCMCQQVWFGPSHTHTCYWTLLALSCIDNKTCIISESSVQICYVGEHSLWAQMRMQQQWDNWLMMLTTPALKGGVNIVANRSQRRATRGRHLSTCRVQLQCQERRLLPLRSVAKALLHRSCNSCSLDRRRCVRLGQLAEGRHCSEGLLRQTIRCLQTPTWRCYQHAHGLSLQGLYLLARQMLSV